MCYCQITDERVMYFSEVLLEPQSRHDLQIDVLWSTHKIIFFLTKRNFNLTALFAVGLRVTCGLLLVALVGARSPSAHHHTQVTSIQVTLAHSGNVKTPCVIIQLVAVSNEFHESPPPKFNFPSEMNLQVVSTTKPPGPEYDKPVRSPL